MRSIAITSCRGMGIYEGAKRRLAITMCSGLGDLVNYSDGQFLEGLLHPALQPAVALLKNAKTEAAVGSAFVQLEDYVSEASGVSGLPLLNLMEKVFKPGDGKLSNGTFRPATGWNRRRNQECKTCSLVACTSEIFMDTVRQKPRLPRR